MELNQIKDIVSSIRGSTFASIDYETKPSPGIRKIVTGETVLLFNTKGISGYESMVRKRLVSLGKDPFAFEVGDLPWGERIDDGPILTHRGDYYLQTIPIREGQVEAFLGKSPLPLDMLKTFTGGDTKIMATAASQGLPPEKAVLVRCYKLSNLTEIRLKGNRIKAAA